MTGDASKYWRAARVVVLIGVTIAIGAALYAINWPRTGDALRQASPAWLAGSILANAAILLCWAAFWLAVRPSLEAPASYGRMLEIVAISSALMNTLPFGGGHASSVVLLIRRAGTTQRGALSTLALDQLGEGLVKVAVFLLVGGLVPLPAWMRIGVTTGSLIVAAWFLTLMIASRWGNGAIGELAILSNWRRAGAALACVTAMRGCQLLAIVAVHHAYALTLPSGGSLLVLASILLASMVPISPGNLGTYEASLFVAYRYLGMPADQALSLAIVQHVCFMLPAVGAGYVVLSAQTLSRRVRAVASP